MQPRSDEELALMNALLGGLRAVPDRAAALASYRALAPRYDAACRPIEPLRLAAIDALALRSGETVYDVACGTGTVLPSLAQRVGAQGRVVGIEQCPDMAQRAMARFPDGALPPNVALLVAAAEEASPSPPADAMLFCFTHDVLQSPRALDNLLAHARSGARVALVGLHLLPWWWGAPVNLWSVWRGRHYRTTVRGLRAPWALIAERLEDLCLVRRFLLGTNYLAVGRVA
jgi:SAM-dependent methyltransferase